MSRTRGTGQTHKIWFRQGLRLSLAATGRHAASWCFRDCVVPKSCVVLGGFINAEAPLLKFYFLNLAIPQNHFLSSTASGRPTAPPCSRGRSATMSSYQGWYDRRPHPETYQGRQGQQSRPQAGQSLPQINCE
jgi:hypothetical protein